MRRAFEMGLVGGQRALTPLAMVSVAAARGQIEGEGRVFAILSNPLVAAGTVILAAAEMAGDKQKTAPDRIVAVGLAARFVTSAIAGAILTPKRRWLGAAIGGGTAVAASFPGWFMRVRSMGRWGQTRTGFIEEAIVLATAASIVRRRDGAAQPG